MQRLKCWIPTNSLEGSNYELITQSYCIFLLNDTISCDQDLGVVWQRVFLEVFSILIHKMIAWVCWVTFLFWVFKCYINDTQIKHHSVVFTYVNLFSPLFIEALPVSRLSSVTTFYPLITDCTHSTMSVTVPLRQRRSAPLQHLTMWHVACGDPICPSAPAIHAVCGIQWTRSVSLQHRSVWHVASQSAPLQDAACNIPIFPFGEIRKENDASGIRCPASS